MLRKRDQTGTERCVIDGEDDTKPGIPINLKQALKGVLKGTLVECSGCSSKGCRAFHTKKSFPGMFKRKVKSWN